MYSDAELEQMLRDGESDYVEFKESLRGEARNNIKVTICAFANDLPNHGRTGVIFVGIKDDGTCANLLIDDKLLQDLANIRPEGNILPLPSLTVQRRTLNGCELAVILIEPADAPPVRYQGRVHIRLGTANQTASAQDERRLNEKRRYKDTPFDLRPLNSATLDDLDLLYFRDGYLSSAIAPDVLDANERPIEQHLESLKFTRSGIPTILGLLVIGKNPTDHLPGAYIQFVRYSGKEITDPPRDEATISGRLAEVIIRIEEKMSAHNSVSLDYISSAREQRFYEYPQAALKQAVRNAVMHRNYEGTHAPIRVYWYDDRIEISNPGGLYGQVQPNNFIAGIMTDYRNPNLASAMKALGFVQRFGAGVPTIYRTLKENGNPEPYFDFRYEQVLVRLSAKV